MSTVDNMDFNYLMRNQKKINTSLSKDVKDGKQIVEYDSKIVSFKIGNEYYGIDIMTVKEILMEKKFTRIPNALDFVRGVLNLRGDIMPVIDLAKLFHLETAKQQQDIESIIIIKVENLLIGLIVEEINQVIPVRKSDVQPPSPLLGSINERYILGVIDIRERLYVILDTEAIFSDKEKTKKEILPLASDLTEEFFVYFTNQLEELCGIHIHQANKSRFRDLYDEYVRENNIKEMPKISKDVADRMLSKFWSVNSEEFWNENLFHAFKKDVGGLVQKICSDEIRVLDVGCANGHETFSAYFALENVISDANIRITAVDFNLGAVSCASGMEVDGNEIPQWMHPNDNFIGTNGNSYKIKKEINDKIYFEFHDAKNLSANDKNFDLIIARDMSLFMKESEYIQFIDDLADHLVKGGVLLLGDREVINSDKFTHVDSEKLTILIKK